MIAVVFVQFAAVLFVEGVRFGAGAPHLAPWPASPTFWSMSTGVFAALAFLRVRRGGRGRSELGAFEWSVSWVLWVATPVLVWSLGDQVVELGSDAVLLLISAILACVALWRERARWSRSVLHGSALGNALSLSVLILGGGLFAWMRAHHGVPPQPTATEEWVVALSTYPVYALGQLLVFLVLPSLYMERQGHGPRARVVVCAILFALVHWPNPFLVGSTAVAMTLWAMARERGAALWSAALAMGWLGALFAQGLPPTATGHMRVGPGYVLKMQQIDHLEALDRRVQFLASDASFEATGGDLEGWLSWMHEEVFGRAISPADLQGWKQEIETGVRSRVLRTVYESAEFATLHGDQPVLDGRDRRLLFPRFEARTPAQAGYEQLRSPETYAALGHDFRAFLARVYRELLQREPSDEELRGWPEMPTASERAEVARMFLRAGPERGFFVFESDDLPLWWPTEPLPTVESSRRPGRAHL